jgi:hypothetical protein
VCEGVLCGGGRAATSTSEHTSSGVGWRAGAPNAGGSASGCLLLLLLWVVVVVVVVLYSLPCCWARVRLVRSAGGGGAATTRPPGVGWPQAGRGRSCMTLVAEESVMDLQ